MIMRGSKGPDNELSINNDELYAKRILEKFEKKESSENVDNNKNGSADNSDSHFNEIQEILKEKEAEMDISIQQPPRVFTFTNVYIVTTNYHKCSFSHQLYCQI